MRARSTVRDRPASRRRELRCRHQLVMRLIRFVPPLDNDDGRFLLLGSRRIGDPVARHFAIDGICVMAIGAMRLRVVPVLVACGSELSTTGSSGRYRRQDRRGLHRPAPAGFVLRDARTPRTRRSSSTSSRSATRLSADYTTSFKKRTTTRRPPRAKGDQAQCTKNGTDHVANANEVAVMARTTWAAREDHGADPQPGPQRPMPHGVAGQHQPRPHEDLGPGEPLRVPH